jgi:hypothetical protein
MSTINNFSLIGQRAVFVCTNYPMGHLLSFSSTLDKIGKELDRTMLNGSRVEISSDPFIVDTEKYGKMEVIKILNDKVEMWLPLIYLKLESKGQC